MWWVAGFYLRSERKHGAGLTDDARVGFAGGGQHKLPAAHSVDIPARAAHPFSRRSRTASARRFMKTRCISQLALGAVLFTAPAPAFAQIPLAPLRASGQTVTPVFEGWYKNPDGSYSLSFGYYNRNTSEEIDVPLGPDNSIEPRSSDGAQPTHF